MKLIDEINREIDKEISKLVYEMRIIDSDGNISVYYSHPDFKQTFSGAAHLKEEDADFYNESYGTWIAQQRAKSKFLQALGQKWYWDGIRDMPQISMVSSKRNAIEVELALAQAGFPILARNFITERNSLPSYERWDMNR